MTIAEMQQAVREAQSEMGNASNLMREATTRIHELETALARMICAHENVLEDSEGRYPSPDSGCIHCTKGTVPDRLNSGPCAYHNGQKLLGQI